MISVSTATKNAFLSDSFRKKITVTFPNANITYHNDDIDKESLYLEESINSGEQLNFQGCIATKFQFRCATAVRDLRGELVVVTIQAGDTDVIPLFRGYVDDQTNLSHEDVITEFTAYDVLYKLGDTDVTSWYNGLTFPITIKNFRDSLFTLLGLTQVSTTLINDSLTINKIQTKNQLRAIDVMMSICQANGVFGRIGRSGNFEYVSLHEFTTGTYPGTTTYPSDETYPSSDGTDIIITSHDYRRASYEPFSVSQISAVYLIAQDGTKTTQGSGSNVLVLSDNIVAQGCTNKSSLLSALLTQVSWITYIPSNVVARGAPWIECGDVYLFNTKKNAVRAYILTRTLKGIQALFDEYIADGSESREPYKETPKTQISTQEVSLQDEISNRTQSESGIRTSIQQTQNAIQLLVEDVDDVKSEILLLPHSITLSVNGEAGKNSGARITLTLRDANGETVGTSQVGTIYINGDTVFTSDLTDGSTVISGDNILTGTIDARYIEADAISAGSLEVLDNSNNTLFYASRSAKSVSIGGFEIDKNQIKTPAEYVSNGGIALQLPWGTSTYALAVGYTNYYSYGGAPFRVTHTGKMYATDAEITGDITANNLYASAGYIGGSSGGFAINTKGGYHYSLVGTSDTYMYSGYLESGSIFIHSLLDNSEVPKTPTWKRASTAVSNNDYVLTGS